MPFDAGRINVKFVILRLLETDGRLKILDQYRVLITHAGFRLFATAITAGLGDLTWSRQTHAVCKQVPEGEILQ